MFTGIIEEVGVIEKIIRGINSVTFFISTNKILGDTRIGDSICTNGVCLTVTNIINNIFTADVMAETLKCSNLGQLRIGDKVNLERALCLNSRLGGHIVSGHIDGIGTISSINKVDNSTEVVINTKQEILKYIIYKGSITIDGVSLTVAEVRQDEFKVCIIPHTANETILLSKQVGQTVNLECDILGKYVEKLLNIKSEKPKEDISISFLKENGFL